MAFRAHRIGEPTGRGIGAEIKVDIKLVSLTLASPVADRSERQHSRPEAYLTQASGKAVGDGI
jgi:hypothetical protein